MSLSPENWNKRGTNRVLVVSSIQIAELLIFQETLDGTNIVDQVLLQVFRPPSNTIRKPPACNR